MAACFTGIAQLPDMRALRTVTAPYANQGEPSQMEERLLALRRERGDGAL
jgi:hypothetical protein